MAALEVFMGSRGGRSGTGMAVALLVVAPAALAVTGACNHAWDALEPLSSTGGAGPAATVGSTGTGGAAATAGTGGAAMTSSSGGTGGTGGSAPVHCGGTNILSSNFSAAQPDVFASDSQFTVGGGKGTITLPANSSGGLEADTTTMRLYDLTGDHVSLEVTAVPDQTVDTYAVIFLNYDSGDDLFFGLNKGKLGCGFDHDGNQSVPGTTAYDAAAARYWQIRESQGTIYCEISPDGATWTAAGSFDVAQSELASPTGVRVEISASTPSGASAPGVFEFTNLNGGGPATGVWCPALSYTDSFPASGPVPGPAWDRSYTGEKTDSYDQTGGTLNFHFGADSSSSLAYESSVAYDMTGERVSIQVLQLPTMAQGVVYLDVSNDGGTDVYWNMDSDGFSCAYDSDGSNPTIWQGEAPALPAWIGLRESGGAVYCEIYENGAWKSYGSIGGTMDTKRADVLIGTFENSNSTPGNYEAVLAGYNLGPP